MVPSVELHPLKLKYTVIDGKNDNIRQGFVLVSRRARIHDALQSLLGLAAPHTSSSCKRLWVKRDSGTKSGDGFEVVNLSCLDGVLIRRDKSKPPASEMVAGEWARSFGQDDFVKEIDILVETIRPTEDTWPRREMELCNRIQVRFNICSEVCVCVCVCVYAAQGTISSYSLLFLLLGRGFRGCTRCSREMV